MILNFTAPRYAILFLNSEIYIVHVINCKWSRSVIFPLLMFCMRYKLYFSTIRALRTKLFLFLSLFNLNANAQNIFSLGEFLHNFFFSWMMDYKYIHYWIDILCNTPNIFFKAIFPMRIISNLVFFLISMVNYFYGGVLNIWACDSI